MKCIVASALVLLSLVTTACGVEEKSKKEQAEEFYKEQLNLDKQASCNAQGKLYDTFDKPADCDALALSSWKCDRDGLVKRLDGIVNAATILTAVDDNLNANQMTMTQCGETDGHIKLIFVRKWIDGDAARVRSSKIEFTIVGKLAIPGAPNGITPADTSTETDTAISTAPMTSTSTATETDTQAYSFPEGTELHLVGVYESPTDKVTVTANNTERAVIVVSSYDAIEWTIAPADASKIAQVIVSGPATSTVKGVPADIVHHETLGYFDGFPGAEADTMIPKLKALTGLAYTSAQGKYRHDAFTINAAYPRTFPVGTKLLVLGAYEAQTTGGTIPVTVNTPGPVVLVLTSYERVNWNITAAAGTDLRHIYLSGYEVSTVSGAGAGKAQLVDIGYFYQTTGTEVTGVKAKAEQQSGLTTTSVDGSYTGTSFTVN